LLTGLSGVMLVLMAKILIKTRQTEQDIS